MHITPIAYTYIVPWGKLAAMTSIMNLEPHTFVVFRLMCRICFGKLRTKSCSIFITLVIIFLIWYANIGTSVILVKF